MAVTYAQTDTAADCAFGVYCSPLTAAGTPSIAKAVEGGTAGTTARSVSIPAVSTRASHAFEITPDAGVTWAAGNWDITITVQAAQADITLTDVWICRVSSGCVNQATIGSATGLTINFGTTGSKTIPSISGSSQTPNSGDKVIVVLGLANANATMARSGSLTYNGTVVAPFTAAGGVSKTLEDAGAAADTLEVSIPQTVTDSGAATDEVRAAAAVPLLEVAAATDSLEAAATVALADAGTGTDTLEVSRPVTLTDSGQGQDWLSGPAGTLVAFNNFDTGSGAVTPANSGGGNGTAFTSVVGSPAGNSVTYSAAQALVTLGTTAGEAYAAWDSTVLGSQATRFLRIEPTYPAAAPAGSIRLLRVLSVSTTRASVQLTTGRVLQLLNAGGGTVATGTTQVPADQKIRVEVRIVGDAAVGELELRWWSDPAATGPPTERLLATALNTGGVVDALRAGHTGTVQANFSYNADNLAVANDTWAGAAAAGPTQVTLTDATAGADTLQVAAAVPVADQGATTDSLQVTAVVPLADSGAAADSLTVQTTTVQANLQVQWRPHSYDTAASATWAGSQDVAGLVLEIAAVSAGVTQKTLSDSGQATDTLLAAAQIPLPEVAAAADTLQVGAQAVMSESGQAADSVTVGQFEPKAISDSGTAADSLRVAAAVVLAEQGAGSDTLQPTAAVVLADSGQAADSVSVAQGIPKTLTDAGAATDTVSATAQVPLPEQGAGVDSLAVHQTRSLTDSGVGVDSLTVGQFVPKTLNDSGVGTDLLLVATSIPLADQGQGADALQPAATVRLTDQGAASDALEIDATAAKVLADNGTATDQLTINRPLDLTDSAVGADTLRPTAVLVLAETATAADLLALAALSTLTDSGTATEAMVVLTVARWIRTSSRELPTTTSSREPVLATSSREQGAP